jgi:mono/diheme cytochrome c family protein
MRRLCISAVIALIACGAAPAYEPRVNYQLHCMGCHTPNGAGEPGHVPSMRKTLVPFSARADGRRFLVQVPGVAQSRLSNSELADLLNWMIPALSDVPLPSDFRPYTAAEVAAAHR